MTGDGSLVHPFEGEAAQLPHSMPSPFDPLGPHPVARRAAGALMEALRAGAWDTRALEAPEGGKMFGVLVVRRPDGRLGALHAFSALWEGRWQVPGFVPPLFDVAARAAVQQAGEEALARLTAVVDALGQAAPLPQLRAQLTALSQQASDARAAQRALHAERRAARALERAVPGLTPQAAHAVDQRSRADKAERRQREAQHAAARAALEAALHPLERRLAAALRLRAMRSRALMAAIHDTYVVRSFDGQERPLRALYPEGPPSGAGDCAAPKLLAFANAHRLRPLALAEFWWGSAPAGAARSPGTFVEACALKCGPLLPALLQGLEVAPPRAVAEGVAAVQPLEVVHDDAWVVVVNKPAGLLSVPGRGEALTDSALTRLRARWPGLLSVHRLDLDTSGLLLFAKDAATHAALQRQFEARAVHKRYVAVLEGAVREEAGSIALPLGEDLAHRPRQQVDALHGRPARTEYRVLSREGGRTRVALFPHTGRTHQLRVHVAHPRGLGCPIVGDRLYGLGGAARLLLHAEALEFEHPGTGARARFEAPAPF